MYSPDINFVTLKVLNLRLIPYSRSSHFNCDFHVTYYNIQRDIYPTFDVMLCVNTMLKSNYARDSYLNTGNLLSVVLVKDIRRNVYVKAN